MVNKTPIIPARLGVGMDFLDQLTSYDFQELVTLSAQIENRIIHELLQRIEAMLESLGARYASRTASYLLLDSVFSFSAHYYEESRILALHLKSLKATRTKLLSVPPPSAPQQIIPITSFGNIANVTITYDNTDFVKLLGGPLERIIRDYLTRAYETIALALDLAARRFRAGIFDRLYQFVDRAVFRTQPSFSHKGHYWLIIFSGDEGLFLYDDDFLREAMVHLRRPARQVSEYSPYQLTIALLTHGLPFLRTLSHQTFALKQKTMSLGFKKSGYAAAANELWTAIGGVQDFKDFTVYPIAEVDDHRLVAGFKASYGANFTTVLDTIKFELAEEFRASIGQYDSYFSKVHSLGNHPGSSRIQVQTDFTPGGGASAVTPSRTPVKRVDQIFVSYSQTDSAWLLRLQGALRPLEHRLGSLWSDKHIKPGELWEETLNTALARSSAALLLISQAYFASEYIWNHEFPAILNMRAKGRLKVFWIPVGASLYCETSLKWIQALHPPSDPLNRLSESDRDHAMVKIGKSFIRHVDAE